MSVSNILSENNYTGYFENLNVEGDLVVNNVTISNLTADNLTTDSLTTNSEIINTSLSMGSTSTTFFNSGSNITGAMNVAGGNINISDLATCTVACDIDILLDKAIIFPLGRFDYATQTFTCNVTFTSSGASILGTVNIILVKSGRSATMFVPSISFAPNTGPGNYLIDLSAVVGTRFEPIEARNWICAVFTGPAAANVIPGLLDLSTSGTITIYGGLASTLNFPGAGTAQGLVGGTSFVYRCIP